MDIDGVPGPMDKSSDIDAREFPGKAVFPNPNYAQTLKNGCFSYYLTFWRQYWPHLQEKDYKKA
jgi:hypothetical protein